MLLLQHGAARSKLDQRGRQAGDLACAGGERRGELPALMKLLRTNETLERSSDPHGPITAAGATPMTLADSESRVVRLSLRPPARRGALGASAHPMFVAYRMR